jgi:MOSC domain-containing protein YiiM
MIEVGPYTYTNKDARKTIASMGHLWEELVRGRDATTAEDDGRQLVARLAAALDQPIEGAEHLDAAGITRAAHALGPAAAASFGLPGWGPREVTALLTDVTAAFRRSMEELRRAGQLPASATGHVAQLNTSSGGVPKLPRPSVDVTFGGVRGDVQQAREHHGRPWQALSLWSQEVIDGFVAAGHPIHAGAAGENVTIAGLDWADVRPGVRLRLGDVLAEVWSFAWPCKKNNQWFADGDSRHMHHDRGPVSRVYALVLETGRIEQGDEVVLEPPVRRPGEQPPDARRTSIPGAIGQVR